MEMLFKKKSHVIARHVNKYELIKYMKSKKMLTYQDESSLSGLFEPTDTLTEMFKDVMLDTMSDRFMEILKGKPEEFYWKLLRALRKSGHDHVVPMLEGPGK